MSTNFPRIGNAPITPNPKPLAHVKLGNPSINVQISPPERPITLSGIPIDRAITTRQAAAILGVAIETLKKWRQRPGAGPKFIRYPDGAIRYRLSSITKFLEECTIER